MTLIIKKRLTSSTIKKALKKIDSATKKRVDKANSTIKNTKKPKDILDQAKKEAKKIKSDAKEKATLDIATAKSKLKKATKRLDSKKKELQQAEKDLATAKDRKNRANLINGLISPTKSFSTLWKDSGSGAHASVRFYRAKSRAKYRRIGDGVYPSSGDKNGKFSVMQLFYSKKLIKYANPVDFVRVWKDSGSGASWDGAIWKAVPPKGYVAMGMLATRGYKKPSKTSMFCVHKEFTKLEKAKDQVWNDKGSGSNSNISVWYNHQLGTFWAHSSYGKPGKVIRVFDLKKIEEHLKK